MAEAHHLKLQSLIKQQALEVFCVPAVGEKVHWLLTGPVTSSSSSDSNCCADDLFLTAT